MGELNIRLLEKRNRKGRREYRIFYIHFPRKLIDAIGWRNGDVLQVKVVLYEGRQSIVLYPMGGEQ